MKPAVMLALLIAVTPFTPQTFRSGADAVRVDVLVTDGKQPFGGLTAADFELRDRGVMQKVEAFSVEPLPLSVMLVLDHSGSVEGLPLAHLKQGAAALLGLLQPGDRVALLTFAGALKMEQDWTDAHGLVGAALQRIAAGGSTTLFDAAHAALTMRDPRPGRSLALIFSDGVDTVSWLPGAPVIEGARRNDVVIYGVTLEDRGRRANDYRVDFRSGIQASLHPSVRLTAPQPFLDALTEETGGKVIRTDRSEQLRGAFLQILAEFRSRYLLTFTPRGVAAGGWHPLEVKVKGRRLSVTARRGYQR